MSSYLFVLVMEVLSMVIRNKVEQDVSHGQPFQYHWRCQKTKITHLCFADDLMLFCGDSLHSAKILQHALLEFYALSGLTPNHDKSCIFIAGSNHHYKEQMLQLFQFPEGILPVRYLGAPLITTKLTAADCKPLVEGITCKIRHWASKLLSFAGRVQLIQSVLCSFQSFWNGLFILPKKVLKDVEQLMRRFLWKGPSLNKGGAKVAWEDVTLPLEEGGLGIKKLQD